MKIKSVMSEAWHRLNERPIFFLILVIGLIVGRFILDWVGQQLIDLGWWAVLLWTFVTLMIQLYVSLVLIIIAVKTVRQETIDLTQLVIKDWPLIKQYVLVSIVYGFIVVVGTLLLVVPGILWGIRYSLGTYLVMDRHLGWKAALQKSRQLTVGNRGKLFLIGLILVVISVIGLVIPWGLGSIVTIPFTLLVGAVVYTRLLSQISFGD